MTELLEKAKQDASNEMYSLPYEFLTHLQKADIVDLVAINFADAVTKELKSRIIPNT